MNKFTVFLQKYCTVAFGLLIVLRACNTGLKAVNVAREDSKVQQMAEEAFGDNSPEELFAFLDNDKQQGDEKPYVNLLVKLERECFEGKKEIALLGFTSYKKYQQAEIDYSILEVLDYYLSIAQSTNNVDSCKDIHRYIAKEYK